MAISLFTLAAAFTLCAEAPRVNCVVDGDTFWMNGEKVRLADINAPETAQASCAEERTLGQRAKLRLLDLLNAFHGLRMTADDVTALGKKVLQWEREFNAKAGFTKAQDRLPEYFRKELLPPHNVTFQVPDAEMDRVFDG